MDAIAIKVTLTNECRIMEIWAVKQVRERFCFGDGEHSFECQWTFYFLLGPGGEYLGLGIGVVNQGPIEWESAVGSKLIPCSDAEVALRKGIIFLF